MNRRTILIGLDGATFTVLDALMEENVMPFLKKFTASGARGKLISVTPPLTPPAWTTVMTGRSPGNHGIFDFMRFESPQSRYLAINNLRHVRCETIWSMASRQGLRAASLNFVMMSPLRPFSGYIIPGWVSWRHIRHVFHPPELYERVKALPGFDLKELSMDVTMDEKAMEGCPEEEYEGWVRLHIRREQQWFSVWRYLMKESPCELMAIVLDGVDKLQHLCWRFISPELLPRSPSPWEQKIRSLCLDYFRQVDAFIAETVAMTGGEANIIIVSDHGFSTTSEIVYMNSWLQQRGYLEWADGASTTASLPGKLGLELPRKQAYLLDWTKTKAYAVTPSSNGIHICIAGQRGENGITPGEYENFRKELADSLRRFVDPQTGQPVITRVGTREELFAGSQVKDAPDLTVTLRDGGFISILKSDKLVETRPEPLGTHHPEGIFIAGGPDIRKGLSAPQFSILDVAPTLLHSLGLPVPDDLEGRALAEVFTPSYMQKYPVKTGEPTIPPEPFPGLAVPAQDEEQKEIMTRLKALGYM